MVDEDEDEDEDEDGDEDEKLTIGERRKYSTNERSWTGLID